MPVHAVSRTDLAAKLDELQSPQSRERVLTVTKNDSEFLIVTEAKAFWAVDGQETR